jgi:hypothetical protein
MDPLAAFTMALAGSLVVTVAHSMDTPSTAAQPGAARQYFDIPAQPLHAALEAFGAASGWSGLYSADTTAGRMSRGISGWYSADAALRLLTGGALAVHYTAADAFVLEPDVQALSAMQAVPAAPAPSIEALLQSGVRHAFCREPRLVKGDYRVAFSLRLGARGRVQDARLLGSTGNSGRDAAVLAALRGIDLGTGPADPAQAFVMLILPQQNTSRECAAMP